MEHPNKKYLKPGVLPHMFCPGCASGQITNYFLYAVDQLGLDWDKLVAIGGVGCTSRAPAYLNANAIHGIHGRNLPFATGIKLTNPELTVVILMGDGGTAAIGGNHLIQAARRNLDVTVIVDNNGVQLSGSNKEIMDLAPFAKKWEAFGWNVTEVDGHDLAQILDDLDKA